jgi:hypothetical protein
VLAAQNKPWLGTTFGAETTCTEPCTAVVVTGFAATSIPLAAILPQGLPGCLLLVTPDILTAFSPIFGQVFSVVTVPNTPSRAGPQRSWRLQSARVAAIATG